MSFNEQYSEKVSYIDKYIESYIDSIEDVEPVLKDGMKYAVLNGGKRLRSILCMEMCRMFSGNVEVAMPFAAAIEFIHAYSLVHDDLPAMDNDDFRRGLPSCHKKFGEDIAILIGDALLNTAFELMLDYANDKKTVSAAKIIAYNAGIHGMINGQMKDLALLKKSDIKEDDLISLIEQKTMALIRCSAVSGALVGGCSESQLNIVDEYAYNLGLAFQIRDDFEDYSEDQEDSHASPNLINILGFDVAKNKLSFHYDKSNEKLSLLDNSEFLKELNTYLFSEV